MREEWRDIKGYEGKYQVSNLGRVKSLNYRRTKKEEILKSLPRSNQGYLSIELCKNGKSKPYYIHRLVATHFIANPNNYKEINHKDENKENNKVSNLEWCSREYNQNYGTRTQRASKKISKTRKDKGLSKGSKNPKATKVQCVTTGKIFNCIKEAAEFYHINSFNNITHCCRGKRNSAGKHPDTGEKLVWKYIDSK